MNKCKILFDATELSYFLEESGHRAGVFFVALNIFRELRKRKNVELVFCCNFKRYYFLKEVIEEVKEFQGIELLKENSRINLVFAKLNYLSSFKWIATPLTRLKLSPLAPCGRGDGGEGCITRKAIHNILTKLKYGILSLSRYYENIFYRQNKRKTGRTWRAADACRYRRCRCR